MLTTASRRRMVTVGVKMARLEVDEALLEGLDRFIYDRDRPPRGHMTRDEAVSVIIRDWLMSQGYVPLPDDPDKITTAFDAAEVPKA
jgi:hypothetical protein